LYGILEYKFVGLIVLKENRSYLQVSIRNSW
jgi:hypothetical protein